MLKKECFQTATLLFYEAKYDQALRAITQYIQQKPRSSMAFNNRGLIQLSMGRPDLAKEDLETALQLNHLNYVAYFNLLSVHCKQDNHRSGLLALQGALSCLYLIKGRLLQDKSLLSMAIELSTNNIDAILLLVLLEARDRNYEQSLVLV